MLEAIDQGWAGFGSDAQQDLTGCHPVIFLTIRDRHGKIVLSGPPVVAKDTAKEVNRTQRGYR